MPATASPTGTAPPTAPWIRPKRSRKRIRRRIRKLNRMWKIASFRSHRPPRRRPHPARRACSPPRARPSARRRPSTPDRATAAHPPHHAHHGRPQPNRAGPASIRPQSAPARPPTVSRRARRRVIVEMLAHRHARHERTAPCGEHATRLRGRLDPGLPTAAVVGLRLDEPARLDRHALVPAPHFHRRTDPPCPRELRAEIACRAHPRPACGLPVLQRKVQYDFQNARHGSSGVGRPSAARPAHVGELRRSPSYTALFTASEAQRRVRQANRPHAAHPPALSVSQPSDQPECAEFQLTYCAMPLPNDQSSFSTSTRLTNTSSRRTPGRCAS